MRHPMDLGLCELAEKIRAREVSAREATEASLERISRLDGKLNAYTHVAEESALATADRVDARLAAGQPVGLLAGVPVAVKDCICTQGLPTTAASKILAGYIPPYDATVVHALRAADAVIVGKTNQDEFAMGGSCEHSCYGPTRNPWNTDCIPGGSSGGSASAVGGRTVPLALGSDTGGSIRQPAAMCGITGLKPTYGRVSRYGLLAFASSLDQIGPLTRSAADSALAMQVLAGRDPMDSTSADLPVPRYMDKLRQPLAGLRLGLAREYLELSVDEQVARRVHSAAETLAKAGAEIREVSLPHTRYAVAVYQIIATAEASSNLARYDGVHYGHRTAQPHDVYELYAASRSEGFGKEVQRRIFLGTFVLSAGYYEAYYLRAQKVRTLLRRDFEQAFEQVDAIICPTSPVPTYPLGTNVNDPLRMYALDSLTVATNLAGIPGISVPCGFTAEGLPVGLQILAPHHADDRCLAVAHQYQTLTEHHLAAPPLVQTAG